MKPRAHADLIKKWADGAEIEFFSGNIWRPVATPSWLPERRYRIKPERVILKSRRFIRKYRQLYSIGICTPENLCVVQNDPDIIWIDPVWIETEVLVPTEKE